MEPHGYRIALVTGASRGIGAAIVRALATRDLEVHAVARSRAALQDLARETGCVSHVADLTDPAALDALFADLPVDVLVNNLGAVTSLRPMAEIAPDELDGMIDLNLRVTLQVLRRALPGMIARGRGHVFFMTSAAAVHTQPGLPLYGACKAALHAMTAGLRLELAGRAIRVTEILPGRVETDIYVGAMGGDRAAAREALYAGRQALRPEDVAAAVCYALDAPPHVNVSGLELVPTLQVFGGMVFPETGGAG